MEQERDFVETIFTRQHLATLFTIHVNLHTMEFPLIFGETNFVEVSKIREIYNSRKKSALRYSRRFGRKKAWQVNCFRTLVRKSLVNE